MVRGPSEKLVGLVIEQAYEELNLRPTAEQVKAVLYGSPVPTVVPSEPVPPAATSTAETDSPDTPPERRPRRKGAKIVAYELWGERHEVRTWKAMLVGVAEDLHQRHGRGFDRILTLRGRKYPHASRDPDKLAATPKLVGTSEIYIETHGSAEQLKHQAGKFLKLFGHSADDLRIETRTD